MISLDLALDPSFTRLGIFALAREGEIPLSFQKRTRNGKMGFHSIKSPHAKRKIKTDLTYSVRGGFPIANHVTTIMLEEILTLVEGCEVRNLITEIPPPIGNAAVLFLLDSAIINNPNLGKVVYQVPAPAIPSFFGCQKPPKKMIVQYVMDDMGKHAIKVNHDEASAYMVMRLTQWRLRGVLKAPVIYRYDRKSLPTPI